MLPEVDAAKHYERKTNQIQKANHHYHIGNYAATHIWFRPKILYHQYHLAFCINMANS